MLGLSNIDDASIHTLLLSTFLINFSFDRAGQYRQLPREVNFATVVFELHGRAVVKRSIIALML